MFLQTNIERFMMQKKASSGPFIPIDRVGQAQVEAKSPKRGRGRPRKNLDQSKSPAKSANNHAIEEYKSEGDHSHDNTDSALNNPKSRGHYHLMDYATKLKIIQKFKQFKDNNQIIDGKKMSFDEFYKLLADEFSESWQTVKSLCIQYSKNNAIMTQLEFLCSTKTSAKKSGQIFIRPPRLTYPDEIDKMLVDWIYASLDVGYIMTREAITDKAKELITDSNPEFKASDPWLQAFLNRHHLSLRKLNEKTPLEVEQLAALAEKVKNGVKDQIKKFKIPKCRIINMDESPYYWEYLPRKVIAPKLSKIASGWKHGYHNHRSTLMLSVSADGHMLTPCIILKRESAYTLKCDNEIKMTIYNSPNGWSNEDLIIKWLDDILLPYVKGKHCILLWDTYEAHKSDKVLEYLKKHPHVHIGMIVGGRTSKDQPLDISINKQFKDICKKESICYTNSLIRFLDESNYLTAQSNTRDETVVQSKYLLLL